MYWCKLFIMFSQKTFHLLKKRIALCGQFLRNQRIIPVTNISELVQYVLLPHKEDVAKPCALNTFLDGLAELGVNKNLIKNKKLLSDLLEKEQAYNDNESDGETSDGASSDHAEEETTSETNSEQQESETDSHTSGQEAESDNQCFAHLLQNSKKSRSSLPTLRKFKCRSLRLSS